jgi:hypothetical protein
MARELKIDDIVKTENGRGLLCRVRSLYRGEADLVSLVDDIELSLPVHELRRVPDPRNKLPKIEGMPDQRPICQRCKRPLRPVSMDHYNESRDPLAPRIDRRVFSRWDGYGHADLEYTNGEGETNYVPLFCTARCAMQFAVIVYRSGMRIKGIKSQFP